MPRLSDPTLFHGIGMIKRTLAHECEPFPPSAPRRRYCYQGKFGGLCKVQTAVKPGRRLRIWILLKYNLGSVCRTVKPLKSNTRGIILNMEGVSAWPLAETDQASDQRQNHKDNGLFVATML